MEMLKKLAKKEIKFAHGLSIIIVCAIIATIIVANQAKAFWVSYSYAFPATYSFGGKITKVVVCTPNSSGTCPQCQFCQTWGCSATMYEIDFTPAAGSASNHICPDTNFRIDGNSLGTGSNILGEYKMFTRFPVQIGVDSVQWDSR